jgi:hypothetical protein
MALETMKDGKHSHLIPSFYEKLVNMGAECHCDRRWIFIIEGVMTVVVGVIAKFWLVDWPEQAKFLSADEKALLARKLADDAGGGAARMDRLDKSAIRRILTDWKIYTGIL